MLKLLLSLSVFLVHTANANNVLTSYSKQLNYAPIPQSLKPICRLAQYNGDADTDTDGGEDGGGGVDGGADGGEGVDGGADGGEGVDGGADGGEGVDEGADGDGPSTESSPW